MGDAVLLRSELRRRLIVEDWYSLAMTVGDFRRAGASRHLPGDRDRVVLLVPWGLVRCGGGGQRICGLSTSSRVENRGRVAGTAATSVGQRVTRRPFNDRRARQVVDRWHEQGVEGPWTLTRWIDTKNAWDAAEVAKRLQLTGDEAVSLLGAVSYKRSSAWGSGALAPARRRSSNANVGTRTRRRNGRSRGH